MPNLLQKTIVLERLTGSALAIKGFLLSGPGKDDYVLGSETCTKGPVEKSCEVRISFVPKTEGQRRAELIVLAPDNSVIGRANLTPKSTPIVTAPGQLVPLDRPKVAQDTIQSSIDSAIGNTSSSETPCENTYRLTLDGSGFAKWTVNTSRLCFGAKSVIKKKAPSPVVRPLIIESESKRPLTPDYHLDGEAAKDYVVLLGNCKQANKVCSLEIQFLPQDTKVRRAFLVLRPDTDTPPVTVELFGKGKSRNPFKRFGRWVVGIFTDQAKKDCKE